MISDILWTEDLSVGVESIDNQHKSLINATNDFLRASENPNNHEQFVRTILFLEHYVKIHFFSEEIYMDQHFYPDMVDHVKQHRDFTSYVNDLGQRIRRKGIPKEIVVEIKERILEWYINHITISDKKLANFLHKKLAPNGPLIMVSELSTEETEYIKFRLAAIGMQSLTGATDDAYLEMIRIRKPAAMIIGIPHDQDLLISFIERIRQLPELENIPIMAIVPPPVTTHSAFLKTLKIKKTLELPVKTNKLKDKLHEMLGISDGQ